MSRREIQVRCPDCGVVLRVDAATGQVLGTPVPAESGGPADLGEAVRRTQARSSRRKSAFEEALEAERRHKQELERRFRDAADKARDEPVEPPENPLDDRWR